jgi:hypothetical protein
MYREIKSQTRKKRLLQGKRHGDKRKNNALPPHSKSIGLSITNPQNKVNNNGRQKSQGQNSRSKAVIDPALSTTPDTLSAPVEGDECIDHGRHGDDGEEGGGDTADAITEIEEPDGETAQDDGEVEP